MKTLHLETRVSSNDLVNLTNYMDDLVTWARSTSGEELTGIMIRELLECCDYDKDKNFLRYNKTKLDHLRIRYENMALVFTEPSKTLEQFLKERSLQFNVTVPASQK